MGFWHCQRVFTIRQAFLRVLNSPITDEEGFSDTLLLKNITLEINDDSVLTIEALGELITVCQADSECWSKNSHKNSKMCRVVRIFIHFNR